ncbi:defensin-C-like [Toxorhynchites rutilus septentrionalis]|uniref:defensin-C-like n=1 Tax=Toxorhynchites rutilus septentrionalis TaxID=329112 RepID=UPI0024794540|nr:defensin-C-like [Toxorhynchites rutilus septentrionalis]
MQSFGTICVIAALCVAAVISSGYAYPQELADEVQSQVNTLFDELPEESYQAAVDNYRLKRATCDLLSGFGVGDSACAAHCIARRNRGGYCNSKKVCVCRN